MSLVRYLETGLANNERDYCACASIFITRSVSGLYAKIDRFQSHSVGERAKRARHSQVCSIETRKMVPITGRARSFLLVFKNKIEWRGRQNKNNRPINLPNVITFSTDFKYTNPNLYHTQ